MPFSSGNVVTRALLAALFAAFAAGCQIFGEDGGARSYHALVADSCAPNDGPATEVFLTEDPASCADLPRFQPGEPQQRTFIRLLFYNQSSPDDTVLFFGDGAEGNGQGQRCVKGGECTPVRSATVRLGPAARDGTRLVNVEATLEDGSRITQGYTAQTCRPQFLCG